MTMKGNILKKNGWNEKSIYYCATIVKMTMNNNVDLEKKDNDEKFSQTFTTQKGKFNMSNKLHA